MKELQDRIQIICYASVGGLLLIHTLIQIILNGCQLRFGNKAKIGGSENQNKYEDETKLDADTKRLKFQSTMSSDFVQQLQIGETMSLSIKKDDKYATPDVEDLIRVDELIIQENVENSVEPMSQELLGLYIQKRMRIGQARRQRLYENVMNPKRKKKMKACECLSTAEGLVRRNTIRSDKLLDFGQGLADRGRHPSFIQRASEFSGPQNAPLIGSDKNSRRNSQPSIGENSDYDQGSARDSKRKTTTALDNSTLPLHMRLHKEDKDLILPVKPPKGKLPPLKAKTLGLPPLKNAQLLQPTKIESDQQIKEDVIEDYQDY